MLDKGFVTMKDHMGSDLTVANAARVSFNKQNWNGLSQKDEALIQYLAKHEHWCYDSETEIFTDRGWVPFPSLSDTDKVAEVKLDGSMSFVTPEKIHRDPFVGEMYLCEGSTMNYCVTPGHRMLVETKRSNGYTPPKVMSIEAVHERTWRAPTTAALAPETPYSHEEHNDGFIVGMFIADGFQLNKSHWSMRLKVNRKIDGMLSRLESPDVTTKNGVTTINMPAKFPLGKAHEKRIPDDVWSRSVSFLSGLLHGIMEGDGSVKHGGFAYSTSSPRLARDVDRLATLLGWCVSMNKPRHLSNPNHNVNYRLILKSRRKATNRNAVVSRKPYAGMVYCVTVPSGLVLVRRHNKPLVCGNTPFGHPQITLHMKMPIFVARQFMRSNVGVVYNEVSRRYVDTPPEFYEPKEWRGRPEKSIKQGSGDALNAGAQVDAHTMYGVRRETLQAYNTMLQAGVAPEMARMVLPLSTYTEFWATMSLAAAARMYKLRINPHAQWEIQEYARAMGELIKPVFPVSWDALTKEVKSE